jgi:chemotaxis protein MotB
MMEQAQAKNTKPGAPAWVMTFADLMSLLLCFFVLLLSFSEMDVAKYKQLAGSLKFAFGVQREIKAKEPPKGVNVIAQEFSPGRPEPTQFNVIRQMTTSEQKINLDLGKLRRRPERTPAEDKKEKDTRRAKPTRLTETQKKELEKAKKLAAIRLEQKLQAEQQLATLKERLKQDVAVDDKSLGKLAKAKAAAERSKKLERSAKLISSALGKEIKSGSVDVEKAGQKIIIRVREKASFASGRADLKDAFRPLLARVAKILKASEGKIIVAGHTDNVPIYTERFRSNWELSSARAVSVAHEMMLATQIPSRRFLIQGFADTEPMVQNSSTANRAKNRRVEIILQQGEDKESGDLDISQKKSTPGKTAGLQKRPPQRQTVPEKANVKAPPAVKSKTGTAVTDPARAVKSVPQAPRKKAGAADTDPKGASSGLGIKVGGGQ